MTFVSVLLPGFSQLTDKADTLMVSPGAFLAVVFSDYEAVAAFI